MAIIPTGQITIIDLHDAPVLNAWISASQTTVQTYHNTTATWSPDYVSAGQVLTLNLTKAGAGSSLIGENVSNIVWQKRVGSTITTITSTSSGDTEYKSGTSHSILTTKINTPTENNAVIWTASGTWTDPITQLPVEFAATIEITLVQLAKASVIGHIYAPEGDTFRNHTPATLKINADLYKDGNISEDSRKYKWFAADNSISTPQDNDAGSGWRKITATANTGNEYVNVAFDTATTDQGVLTIKPDAVTNAQTYLVVIIDNAGGTSGTKAKGFLTIRDMDDPIMVVIDSSEGNILKNGLGSTDLTARLFRNGVEIDEMGNTYQYHWFKWQDGNKVTNWGSGVDYKIGKNLEIGANDVNIKTVFKVEVIG